MAASLAGSRRTEHHIVRRWITALGLSTAVAALSAGAAAGTGTDVEPTAERDGARTLEHVLEERLGPAPEGIEWTYFLEPSGIEWTLSIPERHAARLPGADDDPGGIEWTLDVQASGVEWTRD